MGKKYIYVTGRRSNKPFYQMMLYLKLVFKSEHPIISRIPFLNNFYFNKHYGIE